MHVISFKKLREYFSKETDAKVALQDWYKKANKAEWDNFADLKNTFNSADSVGNGRFVFNVKGNHYRVVAIVRFKFKKVLIRWVGNHRDYDKIKNIDKLLDYGKINNTCGIYKSESSLRRVDRRCG